MIYRALTRYEWQQLGCLLSVVVLLFLAGIGLITVLR